MKCHPERVQPSIAERVYQDLAGNPKKRSSAFSDYIVLHFRMTGDLAPGCDARDFNAWWDDHFAHQTTHEPRETAMMDAFGVIPRRYPRTSTTRD